MNKNELLRLLLPPVLTGLFIGTMMSIAINSASACGLAVQPAHAELQGTSPQLQPANGELQGTINGKQLQGN
jgi:hypothetical protein